MRKTFLPSKRYFILTVLGFIWAVFLIAEWPMMICGMADDITAAFSIPNFFNIFIAILGFFVVCLIYTPMCFILSYAVVCIFLLSGRPLKFSEDEISLGYIKKAVYRKEDITGIGIAPLGDGSKVSNIYCNIQGIYIAFGDYKKDDLRKYGIWNVWDKVELRKIFPKIVNFSNRMTSNKKFQKLSPGIVDASGVQVFDGLLWMTYTEEKFRFLKNWLGSKYYDLIQ